MQIYIYLFHFCFTRDSSFLTLLDPRIPCQALKCLCCLGLGLPSAAEDLTEAGGEGLEVTAALTHSAVAQLEQCKFIKENKRRNSGLAKILCGFNMLLV